MTKKNIEQFNQFIESIDDKITEYITLNDNKLTGHISDIQWKLWENYKQIGGTSAGFHGISEYIVFAAFKKFIEILNKPQKFECKKINKDLRFFEVVKDNKRLRIYHSSSLKHFPVNTKLNRAPDIVILKKEQDNFELITVIEIKNGLDKGSINSAINILSQIRTHFKDDPTKYAIFSFGRISTNDTKTIEKLNRFQEIKNNFLITNEKSNKECGFKVMDLSNFFEIIKDELML